MNLQLSTQIFKTEIKEETPLECRDGKESPCSDNMYPLEHLESPEYENYYDSSKIDVLEELKKEFPEEECPQPECRMNSKIVSENMEFLPLENKQRVIIENTKDKLSLNLKDADGNRNDQITIKTERLEQQDIRDNSGATSVHYDDAFTSQEFKSKFCGKIIKNSFNLLKHNDDHIKTEIKTPSDNEFHELHQCQYCDKRFDNYNNMFTHITDVHSENNAKCEICGEQFSSVPNLERHFKLLHELKNLPNQVTTNDMKLCRTVSEVNEMNYKCDKCEGVYKSKHYLTKHINRMHYDYGKTFDCWCGEQFRSPIHLNEHKIRRHRTNGKNELNKCNHCETVYITKSSLTRHMNSAHYDYGRTFDCWCGKQFRTPQFYREHTRRQHGGKMNVINDEKVQCDYCQKKFKTKQYLSDHIKIVHYDYGKVFGCWCGKQFRTPIHLRKHKKRHSDGNVNDTNNEKLYRHNNL